MSLVVTDHRCGEEVLGRVSLRVSFGMFLVVSTLHVVKIFKLQVKEATGVSTRSGFDLQTSFYAVLAVWLQLRSVCIIPLIRHRDEFLELPARRNVFAILSLFV